MRLRTVLCLQLLAAVLLGTLTMRAAAPPRPVPAHFALIDLHDTLQPERARVFAEQMDQANHTDAKAIVVILSTPGGMIASTNTMVDAMRQSRLPIIVWSGERSMRISGEGLRLMAEADLALMGPNTFLTPLWSDPPRWLSAEHRAAGSAHLRQELTAAVARHGRSPALIDELCDGTRWFSASQALDAGFIDGIAAREDQVLQFASTHPVHRGGTILPLNIAGAHGITVGISPQNLLLVSLMNPDLSVLVLTLGLLLIYLEINTPGTIVPGAAGVLMVLLSIFELTRLPIHASGVWLCVAAVLLLLLEARLSAHGLLATFGVIILVGGLGLIVDGPIAQLQVGWRTAIGAGVGFGGVTASLIVLGVEARRAKVKTGTEAMLGWLAVAQTPLAPEGQILVRGELWRARLTSKDSFVAAGDRVKVLRADGLTLEVTAVPL